MEGSKGLALTLKLDEHGLEVLENLASAQRCTVEEFVTGLVRKAVRLDEKSRTTGNCNQTGKVRPNAGDGRAPLDAFLPEGADPFAPVTHGDGGLASSFADIQTRMRFAGTPSIFKEMD